jgi:hypothetical protein
MTRSSETQGDGMCGQQVPVTGRKAQPRRVRRGAIVTYAVVLLSASAVFAVMTSTPASASPTARSLIMSGDLPGMDQEGSPSPTTSGDMPGMDHGSDGMPASSPSPTMADEMPGMDHGDGHGGSPTSSPTPSASVDSPWKTHDDSGTGAHEHGSGDSPAKNDDHGSGNMPGMDHGTAAGTAPDRPLAPVLGTFGGATSAVLLSAVFLRRRDRARSQAKQAARAARRAQK